MISFYWKLLKQDLKPYSIRKIFSSTRKVDNQLCFILFG